MSTTTICKKCKEPAVPGRVLCARHAAIQQAYQARWLAKKVGGAVTSKPPRTIAKQDTTPTVVAGIVIAEGVSLDRAIEGLSADLAVLQRAKEIVTNYASRCTHDEAAC